MEIESGTIKGNMANRAISMVQEWRKLHKEELLKDWNLAEQKKPLFTIKPLE